MRPLPYVLSVTGFLCGACSPLDATFSDPDLDWNRMLEQPRYEAYDKSHFFDDGMVMREPPEGSVGWRYGKPRWRHRRPRSSEPPPVTKKLLGQGRDHFETFCGPCHGLDGYGDTMVARNMTLRPPPDLHTKRVRAFGPRRIYDVVTRGYGLMPGYEAQLQGRDRWAVAHYVKALQMSRHAEVAELPAALQRELEKERSP